MRCRTLALLIAFYVSMDLANPFVGCAFNFNWDESVDGVSRQHERLVYQMHGLALPVGSGGQDEALPRIAPVSRLRVGGLDEWFVHLRQAHALRSDPQSPGEDH